MNKASKLVFKISDVRRVLEHSVNAPEQNPVAYTHENVSNPSIVIVHDMGVYLMSNGTPMDLVDERGDGLLRAFCAYAKGCDPSKDENYWQTSVDLVGGDDFAETLENAEDLLECINANPKKRVITFDITDCFWTIKV